MLPPVDLAMHQIPQEARNQILPGQPLEPLLDFGPQPVTNRFPTQPGEGESLHNLSLALCPTTGLIQLAVPFPADDLRPRVPWLTVFEPEGHLDSVAELLAGLPGLGMEDAVVGYSSKDDSLLSRLSVLGFRSNWRIDPAVDLGVTDPCAFVETYQVPFTAGVLGQTLRNRRRPKLFIARHVLEHAYDLMGFLHAAAEVVDDSGYVVLEVPDCSRALVSLDYTTVWEEHTVYFTPFTFRCALEAAGLQPVDFRVYAQAFEDCMVAICQKSSKTTSGWSQEAVQGEISRARLFASSLASVRERCQVRLAAVRSAGGKLALFGAGHLAAAFICIHGVGKEFQFVADDNPNKAGRFMPGTNLPIKPSPALLDERITKCLLSLNPESEERVIGRQTAFVEAGGRFESIFPSSPRSFLL
jgi:hypothetical protein